MKLREFDLTYRVRFRKIAQRERTPFWMYYTYKRSPTLWTTFQYLGNTKSFSLRKLLQLQVMVLVFHVWQHAPHSYRVSHAEQYKRWCGGL